LRAIGSLQQKVRALEAEAAHRRRVEGELLAQLADADRRKDEFLAMLGHELRNPLSPVATALELMRLCPGDPEVISRSRDIVERQMALMRRLVDDLLDVSRITRGLIEMREGPVSLAHVVERGVELVRAALEQRRHRLVLDLPASPVVFLGDNARLEQMLANLLHNAVKFTDPGGRIAISARLVDETIIIAIRDNGIGLPPGERSRIFDLFVQAPHSPGETRGGLGVGLTLVRRVVHMHGGSVEAISDGLGRGSQFVVRLPYHTAREPVATP
jgi:two-component system CheB/CheR fusion protein